MTEPTIDPAAIPPGGSQVPVSKAEEAASEATLQECEAEAVEAEMSEGGALEAAAPSMRRLGRTACVGAPRHSPSGSEIRALELELT